MINKKYIYWLSLLFNLVFLEDKIIFESANPFTFKDIIVSLDDLEPQEVYGILKFPEDFNSNDKYPLVLGVAGSLGWNEHNYEYMQMYRMENLNTVFGPDIFIKHHILETSAPKHDVLAEYKDSGLYWIEDKWDNAVVGADMGLIPLVMRDETNAMYTDNRIKHFDNWIQIYKHISGNNAIPEFSILG